MNELNMFNVFLFSLEIFGTCIFAITGATKAIKKELDLLGVIVLASLVGVGGGMIRDALLGATPVAAVENESYLLISIGTGLIFFFLAPKISSEINLIHYGDAIGLGVFTLTGAAKAANLDLSFLAIILSGVITAVGGGILRDVLIGEIPAVLKSDFYATASLIGGVIFFILNSLEMPFILIFFIVTPIVIALRLWGMSFKIQLPNSHFKD